MVDRTPHQKKIIERYYDHRQTIMLEKLGNVVTELFLADSPAKRDRLWARAAKAMAGLEIPAELARHILKQRSPEVLARNLTEWLTQPGQKPGPGPQS